MAPRNCDPDPGSPSYCFARLFRPHRPLLSSPMRLLDGERVTASDGYHQRLLSTPTTTLQHPDHHAATIVDDEGLCSAPPTRTTRPVKFVVPGCGSLLFSATASTFRFEIFTATNGGLNPRPHSGRLEAAFLVGGGPRRHARSRAGFALLIAVEWRWRRATL